MNTSKFSVLISVYNKDNECHFKQALESLINQSVLPSEIILVIDGYIRPELNDVISDFKENYNNIIIVKNENNLGLGESLKNGLNFCTYEFIARMDSDDISKYDRFERQLEVINKGYDVVSSWSYFFENTIDNQIAIKKRPENHDEIVKLSKKRSPVCHASTMLRKSSVLKAGNYLHCKYYEDYYLWLRMIKTGSIFYNIQDFIYYIRASNEQFGRRGGIQYLINEIFIFYKFYREKLISFENFICNIFNRFFIRLLPITLRRKLYLIIWKNFTS